jgi:hypothetical protein
MPNSFPLDPPADPADSAPLVADSTIRNYHRICNYRTIDMIVFPATETLHVGFAGGSTLVS